MSQHRSLEGLSRPDAAIRRMGYGGRSITLVLCSAREREKSGYIFVERDTVVRDSSLEPEGL